MCTLEMHYSTPAESFVRFCLGKRCVKAKEGGKYLSHDCDFFLSLGERASAGGYNASVPWPTLCH